MRRPRLILLLSVAALAGGIVLSLEMAAVRLFAPHFGYSIYVWGITIGVVMAALVGGSAIGGRLANAPRAEGLLGRALLAGAAWQLLALWAMPALLPRLAPAEDAGVALAALVMFAPSMAAFAATGPILVRLCADEAGIGRAAGLVSALSTTGSLAGILGTIFVLLPRLGTHATLQVLCGVSLAAGAWGELASVGPRRAARGLVPATAASILLTTAPGLGWSEGSVWTAESAYNLVRVVQRGGQRALELNHPSSVHSVRQGRGVWTGRYYDHFALGPVFVPARRALVLGMGAGGSVRSMRVTAPSIEVDAVEIDPRVVEAATRWFDVDAADPRLRVHVMDGRRFLARDRGTYDLVQLDVFQGGPYVPFHLVTEECFRLARARMGDDALLMMNVFDRGRDEALLTRLAATLRRVFPSVMVGRTDAGNFMLFAFTRPPSAERLARRPPALESNAGLRDFVVREAAVPAGAAVFTDDLAPVEEMTRRMLAM
ncbi:MAG: fused MFS/spermidine synthase [Vicinamibacteria bacterium]